MSIEIYFTEIPEKETTEKTNPLKLVSTEKREKLDRYCFPIDFKISLYAELLVRRQAIRFLGLKNVEFSQNKYGKPFLRKYP